MDKLIIDFNFANATEKYLILSISMSIEHTVAITSC